MNQFVLFLQVLSLCLPEESLSLCWPAWVPLVLYNISWGLFKSVAQATIRGQQCYLFFMSKASDLFPLGYNNVIHQSRILGFCDHSYCHLSGSLFNYNRQKVQIQVFYICAGVVTSDISSAHTPSTQGMMGTTDTTGHFTCYEQGCTYSTMTFIKVGIQPPVVRLADSNSFTKHFLGVVLLHIGGCSTILLFVECFVPNFCFVRYSNNHEAVANHQLILISITSSALVTESHSSSISHTFPGLGIRVLPSQ